MQSPLRTSRRKCEAFALLDRCLQRLPCQCSILSTPAYYNKTCRASSTSKAIILVSHSQFPKTTAGPPGNSRYLARERQFVQGGVPHMARDGFASVVALEAWMHSYGLVAAR